MKDLFGNEKHDWKKEWVGMPEYIQERLDPYQEIQIRFYDESEVVEFSKMIDCNITATTKCIVFCRRKRNSSLKVRYEDES
jgi:hypothetical protein